MAKKKKSLASTGKDIDEAFENEESRQEQRQADRANGIDRVFRFGIKPGASGKIVLLDEDYHDGIAFYEHHMRDSAGRWSVFRPCVGEVATCPICENCDSKAGFVMYLSALHLNAYQDKKTKEWRNSRVLLGIKSISAPTFKKVMNLAMKKYGTLRGVTLQLERPKGAATNSARIGEPVEFDDTGLRFGFVKNLKKKYGHDQIKSQDGTTVFKEADVDITSFDYSLLFPLTQDVDEAIEALEKEFGSGTQAGSAKEAASEWDDDDDDAAAEEPKAERKSRKKKRKIEDDEDDDIDMSPPKKRRSVELDEDDDVPKKKKKKAKAEEEEDDDGW